MPFKKKKKGTHSDEAIPGYLATLCTIKISSFKLEVKKSVSLVFSCTPYPLVRVPGLLILVQNKVPTVETRDCSFLVGGLQGFCAGCGGEKPQLEKEPCVCGGGG